MEQLQVWEEDRDRWRWRYRAGRQVELVSNQSFAERDEAVQAARNAYPDLPFEDPARDVRGNDRRLLIAAVLLVLAAIGIAFWLRRSEAGEAKGRTKQEGRER